MTKMPCLFFAAKSKAYKSDPPAEITSQTYQHLELISICLYAKIHIT